MTPSTSHEYQNNIVIINIFVVCSNMGGCIIVVGLGGYTRRRTGRLQSVIQWNDRARVWEILIFKDYVNTQ